MTWQSSTHVDRRGNWYPRMLVAKATYAEEPLSVSTLFCIDTAEKVRYACQRAA